MNRGLAWRAFRETWVTTVVLSLLLFGVEAALAYVLPKFGMQVSQRWLQLEFARGLIQAMLGTELAGRIGPQMFQAIAWVHPVALALAWAHAVVIGTRIPAGEVDRGTIDVLLGLPVSRWEIFLSESAVWMAGAAALLLGAMLGNMLGNLGMPAWQRPPISHLVLVVVNFGCVYVAVAGFAWLVSALSDRQGRAITTVFLILAALFLLHYLAQFWSPLATIAFLSPLHYHRPAQVLASGLCPWRDLGILFGIGAVFWLAGGWIFCRRDLCTV